MKIIINTSNLYFGGGVQVALSFINELKNIEIKNEYHIFLSREINKQIVKKYFPKNFYFYLVDKSPSKIINRKEVVSILNKLEEKINPDIVFTVFGPSYWRPITLHLIGFADGWVYNPDSIAFSRLSFLSRIKMRLAIKYKLFYLRRDADYFVLETNDAADKLINIMNIERNKAFVVGNTVSDIFSNNDYINEDNYFYIKLSIKSNDEFRFLYIAHNHPSKNLKIINEALKYLKDYNIKFILTIDNLSFEKIFDIEVRNKIINVGPIVQASCPSLYKQSDAVISTSLLETFSAVYPESMKMEKPLLSSDFSFSRSICGNSALYFNALSPKDLSEKIVMLIYDEKLQKNLINNGNIKLNTFETAISRATKYLHIIKEIKENNV